MKRLLIICISSIVIACNGRLTDEQKQKIKEEMETSQIKKVSDVEVTEAAFELGRSLSKYIEQKDPQLKNTKLVDSISHVNNVSIVALNQSDSLLREVERKVVEAYLAGGAAELGDNVQKLNADSILYTKPVMVRKPDQSQELAVVLGIRIPKKEIVKRIR